MKLALVLVLALTHAAAADTAADRARGYFKQGKAFQDAGEYVRAAEQYKLAYDADPRPEMLFNIAQAYRLAKQKQEALDYFQRYLELQPNGAGSDEARKHVVTLTKEIDDEKAAKETTTMLAPEPSPVEHVVIEDHGRTLRYAGIGAGAVGIVALGLGIKFGLDASSAADDISNHEGPWTDADQARFEDGERANRNMKIAYAIGGVLVTGGGALYYFGWRARLTPVVTRETAGVAVSGAF